MVIDKATYFNTLLYSHCSFFITYVVNVTYTDIIVDVMELYNTLTTDKCGRSINI